MLQFNADQMQSLTQASLVSRGAADLRAMFDNAATHPPEDLTSVVAQCLDQVQSLGGETVGQFIRFTRLAWMHGEHFTEEEGFAEIFDQDDVDFEEKLEQARALNRLIIAMAEDHRTRVDFNSLNTNTGGLTSGGAINSPGQKLQTLGKISANMDKIAKLPMTSPTQNDDFKKFISRVAHENQNLAISDHPLDELYTKIQHNLPDSMKFILGISLAVKDIAQSFTENPAGFIAESIKNTISFRSYNPEDPYDLVALKNASSQQCLNKVTSGKRIRRLTREQKITDARAIAKSLPSPEREGLEGVATRLSGDMSAVEDARVADHVYKHYDGDTVDKSPPPGHTVAGPEDLAKLGLTEDMLAPPGSGFRALVYKVDPETLGPNEPPYKIVFRGTETLGNWGTNLNQVLGLSTDAYNRAMEIGQAVAASGIGAHFVGHSLGGGLASAAAEVAGPPSTARTFNSSGLHDDTVENYLNCTGPRNPPVDIRAIQVNEDLLTYTQEQSSLKDLTPDARGTKDVIAPPVEGLSRATRHRIGTVIGALEQRKAADEKAIDQALSKTEAAQ